MSIEEFVKSLPEHFTPVERDLILRAYRFAEKAHEGQKRASGEPYITHCLAVAQILSELKVSPAMIIAGLVHDTVEDTDVTVNDIRGEFGDEVAHMVESVTKLTNLPRVTRGDLHEDIELLDEPALPEEEDARKRALTQETLRKTFLAMGDDIRVIIIKLADRLHNMRTLGYISEDRRRRIAQETLDLFAPLANRLGIWQFKWELEDLAFRHLNPAKFKEIADLLSQRRVDRELQVRDIITDMKRVLEKEGIEAEVTGRPKHIYSIYKKMQEKAKSFDMVMDLRGVRLIVPSKPDCYAALGIIHTHWRPMPNEFDDYVAVPKENMYQSLHTSVLYEDGKPLEVQIRTSDMHQNAEFGIAAHWRYKEKGNQLDDAFQQRVNMLRRLMEWRQDVMSAQEFVDGMKTDVFQDRVYVFTPRRDIIDLPVSSTPLDFAYHVHTQIGHRCRGAKVNGKLVTLDYQLQTGEVVEILTAKHGGPSRDWLNTNLKLVNTQRARSKIRAWFKQQDREQNLEQGKLMMDHEFKRLGLVNVDLELVAAAFDLRAVDDIYVGIGCGDLSINRVVNKWAEIIKGDQDILLLPNAPEPKNDGSTVIGLKGLLTTFARCCKPAPPDEIVGYITRGRGVTVHRQDCPNILQKTDKERVIKVNWGQATKTYPVPVEIRAYDRQGLMGDISNVLNEEGVNIIDVNMNVSDHLAGLNLVLAVGNIDQLSRVLTRIENLPNVMEAYRTRPG